MTKYILSLDFGSTLTKYLIMKVQDDDITIYKKGFFDDANTKNVEGKLKKLFDEEKIDIDLSLEIVCTGAKTKSFNETILNKKIIVVSEFEALSYGILLPLNIKEALIASIGTGTAFIYSNIHETKHISGSAMGGGPISAISKWMFNDNDLLDTIKRIENIDRTKIDLFISDFADDNSYESLGKDLTASNLRKISNSSSKEEVTYGLYNMICQNLGIEAILAKNNVVSENNLKKDSIPIIFTGTVTSIPLIKKMLNDIAFDLNEKFDFVDNGMFTAAIGAYEYYLINIRKNF